MTNLTSSAQTKHPAISRPSDQFRSEHAEIKRHLQAISDWAFTLSESPEAKQKETMNKIVTFFNEHIKPHAQWEERKLYPAVDKRASSGPQVFTSSMRYEHGIVGRWIEGLAKEAKAQKANPKEFARQTFRLLGLLDAHFEEEEEVLLPLLDKSMSPAQFKEEILSESAH